MKTKNFKNIFIVLFCILFVNSGVLTGCGSSSVRTNETVLIEDIDLGNNNENLKEHITISGWFENSCTRNLMAYLAQKFPEYTFEYTFLSKGSYGELVDLQLASKVAPDIVMVNQNMAKKHAESGYIADLSDYCKNFTEGGKEAFTYDGRCYAVPNTSEYVCIYYNKELMKANNKNVPTTFSGLLELADYFVKETDIVPLSAGLKEADRVADGAMAILASGYISTADGKTFGERLERGETTFLTEIRPYMSKWQDLCMHRYYTKQMCLMDDEAAIDEFASGKSLMYFGELEDYNLILDRNPDIRLGTMAFNSDLKRKPVLVGGCNCGFAVNAFSEKRDLAEKIVAALATEEGQRALWTDRPGSQTYLKNVKFDSPEVFDALKPVIDSGRMFMPWNDWGSHSSEIYHVFGQELQSIILGEKSIETAFEEMDVKVNQILE